MASNHIVPPCKEDLTLLQETDDFIVISKPSGLLSVPGRLAENNDSVFSRLQRSHKEIHIVHRLDLDTSGIMVVAKHKDALRHLNWQFERRQTHKEYIALTWGLINVDTSEISMPLICDWPNRPKQKVCYETGKSAQTHFEVLNRDKNKNQTRLLLKPITGRSHQLRVHTAAIGHPILGCEFYAHHEAFQAAPRLMLHAAKLAFTCPSTETPVVAQENPPF